MRYTLLAGASALAMGFVTPTLAGNVVLTGHDNDFHQSANAKAAMSAEVTFARNGSSLPVLSIDAGSELTSLLTEIGVPFTNVIPSAVTANMFSNSTYSAFVVASVTTCGGCDNPVGTGTLLQGFEPAIAAFFNAGGGIVGLAGADDPNAYAYVPESGGVTTAIDASTGFVATPTGTSGMPGFVAAEGDTTHNTFAGFDPFYHVAEIQMLENNPAVTIFGSGSIICTGESCTVTGTGGVPEPSTWTMMGLGFFGLAYAASRRKKRGRLPALA